MYILYCYCIVENSRSAVVPTTQCSVTVRPQVMNSIPSRKKIIFYILCSGAATQRSMTPKFGRKWEVECLSTRQKGAPLCLRGIQRESQKKSVVKKRKEKGQRNN